VVPPLADAGFRCITPDLPLGAHEVAVSESADLTPPGLAKLIVDFAEALGLDQPTIVANDTGGALTQIALANHGERIGRAVITSCDAFDNFFPTMFKYLPVLSRVPGGLGLLARSAKLKPVRRAPNAFGWLAHQDVPPEVLDGFTEPLRTDAGVRRDTAKVLQAASGKYTTEAAERLGSFDKPVLIAWAANDKFFPLEHGQRLASILPNATLRTVQDSYSFVPEDQPEELASLIREFMQGGAPQDGAAAPSEAGAAP
jgi:pimeloyl-ACP methyl ester carboxylesterase